MADPSIQTFCCLKPGYENPSITAMFEFNSKPYNIVCLLSSLFGMAGAIYQVYLLFYKFLNNHVLIQLIMDILLINFISCYRELITTHRGGFL
jgi:hypothetical protein